MTDSWHGEKVDKHGNVACNVCGKVQSPSFTACISCCKHDTLAFTEDFDSGWRLGVCCDICGKGFGFYNADLIRDYKIVRR